MNKFTSTKHPRLHPRYDSIDSASRMLTRQVEKRIEPSTLLFSLSCVINLRNIWRKQIVSLLKNKTCILRNDSASQDKHISLGIETWICICKKWFKKSQSLLIILNKKFALICIRTCLYFCINITSLLNVLYFFSLRKLITDDLSLKLILEVFCH